MHTVLGLTASRALMWGSRSGARDLASNGSATGCSAAGGGDAAASRGACASQGSVSAALLDERKRRM